VKPEPYVTITHPKLDVSNLHESYKFLENYAPWRNLADISYAAWKAEFSHPRETRPPFALFETLDERARHDIFMECIADEAMDLQNRSRTYRSPRLSDVRTAARDVKVRTGFSVTGVVYWGRYRYVRILAKYLERNLAVNGGILDKLILIHGDGFEGGLREPRMQAIAGDLAQRYPGVVKNYAHCVWGGFGCVFQSVITAGGTVYIKLDDDVIFIKDGSLEHMVLEMMDNEDYVFYSGSIVNNPTTIGLHKFVGAYPPLSYHWPTLGRTTYPFVEKKDTFETYFGKNLADQHGNQAHEAFIINAAAGRLDVYTFDAWNINECRAGWGQPDMGPVFRGFVRWSINAYVYTRERLELDKYPVSGEDEPTISANWVMRHAPHRAAALGETLFVHAQFYGQRLLGPDFGLRDEILLPWYYEFALQYAAQPFGEWKGNLSLINLYDQMAANWTEVRFSGPNIK